MLFHRLITIRKYLVFALIGIGGLCAVVIVHAQATQTPQRPQDNVDQASVMPASQDVTSSMLSPMDDEQQSATPLSLEPVDNWRAAVGQLLVITDRVDEEANASYRFNACFLKDDECVAHSQGFRDEFRKLSYYYAPSTHNISQNHVSFYISLKDQATPKLVMRFVYVGSQWLYMDQVAILVDGEIIFQQPFSQEHTERRITTGALFCEFGDLLMNDYQDVLQRIVNAQTVAVRITGRGGDAYLDERRLVNMQLQAEEIQLMYDLLREVIESIPVDAVN